MLLNHDFSPAELSNWDRARIHLTAEYMAVLLARPDLDVTANLPIMADLADKAARAVLEVCGILTPGSY